MLRRVRLKIRRSNPCRFESGPGHHEAFAMIIYDLCCENDHKLEGWFASAQDFESQLASGMIRCPQCDSIDLRRVPSAVAIGGHAEPAPLPRSGTATFSAIPNGSQAMALYRQLVNAMMAATEDVGTDFAEEARRMHYDEAPERAIRGQTTDEEYEALKDEGIELIRLPVPRKEDLS